ncbi:MAG: neutral zinc metallopeptidase [Fuerstiella sp.]
MRWRGRERSSNVSDRRGGPGKALIGGGGGLIAILVVLALRFLGAPPEAQQMVAEVAQQMQNRNAAPSAGPGIEDDHQEFISVVLRDTEKVWTRLFAEQVQGGSYKEPELIIFEGTTQTGCGLGNAAMGPFYCPADQRVYIPPSFFDDLASRHQAPGDFAQAYVIAHEVAHHVQYLLGFSQKVSQIRRQGNQQESNRASVRLELQADFLAGVWAYHADREYSILEAGDMQEAIQAANQIGDDTLGHVPERYTHGTSAQRVYWFRRGLSSGKLTDCQLLFEIAYEDL